MSKIKVASVCPLMKLADPQSNLQTLSRWATKAKESKADLVLFPEGFVTGYVTTEMCQAGYCDRETFLSMAESVPGPSTEQIVAMSKSLGLFICAGICEKDGPKRYITQVMADPEKGYVGRYRKVQVGLCETWFAQPGDEFPIFDVRGVSTGIMVCRDKSHPEIARILALEGAQLLLNPHSTTDSKLDAKRGFITWNAKFCTARAIENGCYLILNNNIFDCPIEEEMQAGYTFALDPYGRQIHCDGGSGHEEKMTVIEVDTKVVQQRREMEGKHFNLYSRNPSAYHRLVDANTPTSG